MSEPSDKSKPTGLNPRTELGAPYGKTTAPARKSNDPSAPARMSALTGSTVLVPRGGEWGEQASAAVRERGAHPRIAELITFAAPEDPAELDACHMALALGDYDWLVVTSPRAAEAIIVRDGEPHTAFAESTRIAAVGEATAATLASYGLTVNYTPAEHSASGLVAGWPDPSPTRILWPRSSEATDTIAAGLRERGHEVDAPVAYRTLGQPLEGAAREALRRGEVDFALVTSGSVARQLRVELDSLAARREAGTQPPHPRIATIGPNTTRDTRAAGLVVHYEASARTIASMLDAIDQGRAPATSEPGQDPASTEPGRRPEGE